MQEFLQENCRKFLQGFSQQFPSNDFKIYSRESPRIIFNGNWPMISFVVSNENFSSFPNEIPNKNSPDVVTKIPSRHFSAFVQHFWRILYIDSRRKAAGNFRRTASINTRGKFMEGKESRMNNYDLKKFIVICLNTSE